MIKRLMLQGTLANATFEIDQIAADRVEVGVREYSAVWKYAYNLAVEYLQKFKFIDSDGWVLDPDYFESAILTDETFVRALYVASKDIGIDGYFGKYGFLTIPVLLESLHHDAADGMIKVYSDKGIVPEDYTFHLFSNMLKHSQITGFEDLEISVDQSGRTTQTTLICYSHVDDDYAYHSIKATYVFQGNLAEKYKHIDFKKLSRHCVRYSPYFNYRVDRSRNVEIACIIGFELEDNVPSVWYQKRISSE